VIGLYPHICFSPCSKALLKPIVFKMEPYHGQIFLFVVITIGDKIIAAAL
jgi:hypothetical protein